MGNHLTNRISSDAYVQIPSDILLNIFSFLEYKSLIACAGVCQQWRQILLQHLYLIRGVVQRCIHWSFLIDYIDCYQVNDLPKTLSFEHWVALIHHWHIFNNSEYCGRQREIFRLNDTNGCRWVSCGNILIVYRTSNCCHESSAVSFVRLYHLNERLSYSIPNNLGEDILSCKIQPLRVALAKFDLKENAHWRVDLEGLAVTYITSHESSHIVKCAVLYHPYNERQCILKKTLFTQLDGIPPQLDIHIWKKSFIFISVLTTIEQHFFLIAIQPTEESGCPLKTCNKQLCSVTNLEVELAFNSFESLFTSAKCFPTFLLYFFHKSFFLTTIVLVTKDEICILGTEEIRQPFFSKSAQQPIMLVERQLARIVECTYVATTISPFLDNSTLAEPFSFFYGPVMNFGNIVCVNVPFTSQNRSAVKGINALTRYKPKRNHKILHQASSQMSSSDWSRLHKCSLRTYLKDIFLVRFSLLDNGSLCLMCEGIPYISGSTTFPTISIIEVSP